MKQFIGRYSNIPFYGLLCFLSISFSMFCQDVAKCVKDRYSLARQAARVLVNVNKIPSETKVPRDCVTLCKLEQVLKKHENNPTRALLEEVNGWTDRLLCGVPELGADSARLVSSLLLAGADVNAQYENGDTLLHMVARDTMCGVRFKNAMPIARLIIDAGIDINIRNKWGKTPLMIAYNSNNLYLTVLLVQLNAHWLESEHEYTNPSKLHIAAAKGNHEQVKKLLQVDAIHLRELLDAEIPNIKRMKAILGRTVPVDVADKDGMTPLHWACAAGQIDCINVLLQAGADVDSRNLVYKLTPLHLAAWNGYEETVRVLLQAGAVPDPPSNYLRPAPLDMAVKNGHVKISQILIDAGAQVNQHHREDDLTPLHRAAKGGYTEIAKLLIQAGADVNGQKKYSPLHHAAGAGHAEIAKLLIQAGAKVDQRGVNRDTPLQWAAEEGYVEVVKILIQAGAHLNADVLEGETPINLAAKNGHAEVVRILVQAGADVNDQGNESGDTPLHRAAERGQGEVAKILIQAGAHLNVLNKYVGTPLYEAVIHNHAEVVKILLRAGANVNGLPRKLDTPLHFAAREGRTEVVQILLQAGADPYCKDGKGNSALKVAVGKGHSKLATILRESRPIIFGRSDFCYL